MANAAPPRPFMPCIAISPQMLGMVGMYEMARFVRKIRLFPLQIQVQRTASECSDVDLISHLPWESREEETVGYWIVLAQYSLSCGWQGGHVWLS